MTREKRLDQLLSDVVLTGRNFVKHPLSPGARRAFLEALERANTSYRLEAAQAAAQEAFAPTDDDPHPEPIIRKPYRDD
jgi:hypothetical protein